MSFKGQYKKQFTIAVMPLLRILMLTAILWQFAPLPPVSNNRRGIGRQTRFGTTPVGIVLAVMRLGGHLSRRTGKAKTCDTLVVFPCRSSLMDARAWGVVSDSIMFSDVPAGATHAAHDENSYSHYEQKHET